MPLFYLAITFVSGILLAQGIPSGWAIWIGLGVCGFFLIIFDKALFLKRAGFMSLRTRLHFPAGLLLLILALGGIRYQVSLPHWTEEDLAYYNDQGV